MDLNRQKPKLELYHGTCAACGARMDRGAVICVRCGLDARTGRQFQTRTNSEPRRWGRILGGLLFVMVGAAAVASAPRAVRWYERGVHKLEEDRVAHVRTYMDETYPLCALGETVTVKSAAGGDIVGVFAGSGPGGILMESLQGRLATLPLQLFYPAELLRFDEYLRLVVLRTHAELPCAHHQRLLLLVRPKALDMDLARTVESVRGQNCALCYGTRSILCSTCGGRGTTSAKAEKSCSQCGGTGMYAARLGAGESQCPFCRGMGAVRDTRFEYCPNCAGTGRTPCPRCAGAAPET